MQILVLWRPQNRQHSSGFGNFEGFWKAQPQIRLNARILAIWEGFGKSKVVENHENLQILVFWRPQNRQNSSGFGNFGSFWKAQNGWGCQKLSKIAKFAILGSPESAFCFVIFSDRFNLLEPVYFNLLKLLRRLFNFHKPIATLAHLDNASKDRSQQVIRSVHQLAK